MRRPWLYDINYDELPSEVAQRIKELERQRDELLATTEDHVVRKTVHKNGKVTVVTVHSKIKTTFNTKIGTLLKRGVECNWQDPEVRKKETATKRERYDTAFVGDREKAAQTKLERYGSRTYNNAAKAEATKQKKYGRHGCVNVEAANASKQAKIDSGDNFYFRGVETRKQLYGEHFEVIFEKIAATNMERHNVPYYVMSDAYQQNQRNHISKLNKEWHQRILDATGINCQYEVKPKDANGHVKFSYDLGYDNILIDINPWWSHNLTYSYPYLLKMSKHNNVKFAHNYHQQRLQYANECGYRLIQIWSWDDVDKSLALICNALKHTKQFVIYARKCVIKQIEQKVAKQFQDNYHLQGHLRSQPYCYGLYYNDELVQVMTFGKSRFVNNTEQFELLRLCSANCIVAGGAERLFAKFANEVLQTGQTIISYCDLSKFEGNVYKQLGFELVNVSIGEHYYSMSTGEHHLATTLRRFGADRLIGTNLGKGTDNHQIMIDNDYVFIADAGQQKWLYVKK